METKDVTTINVAYPEADDLHLRIDVGACRLNIAPGDGETWVTGTYDDPTGKLPVRISQEGGIVRISQERDWTAFFDVFGRPPTFDLALGAGRPFALTLETGASENRLDLGGLPISRLELKVGAGKIEIDFSAPNPQEMSLISLTGGAGGIEICNLASANFAEMSVDGGAAGFEFDFGGALQRDAHVKISTGVSSVVVQVPAATTAKISTESVLGDLSIGDGFMKKEGSFWTEAALAGNAPVLTIQASVSLGSLHLRTT